jgi:hypothetical protein
MQGSVAEWMKEPHMPKLFRAMKRDGAHPLIGESGSTLGVRGPNHQKPDVEKLDEQGRACPKGGGMSVRPSVKEIPINMVPKRLASVIPGAIGSNSSWVWTMGEGPFQPAPIAQQLVLRPDSSTHGLVEPQQPIQLADFQFAVSQTRESWTLAPPEDA